MKDSLPESTGETSEKPAEEVEGSSNEGENTAAAVSAVEEAGGEPVGVSLNQNQKDGLRRQVPTLRYFCSCTKRHTVAFRFPEIDCL